MPPGISDERVPGGAAVSRAPLLPVGWMVCLDNFHHPGDLMKPNEKNTVAVLVATAHRSGLLESRALPSIEHQSRPPARVIVVDDSVLMAA